VVTASLEVQKSASNLAEQRNVELDIEGVVLDESGKPIADFSEDLTIKPAEILSSPSRRVVYNHQLRLAPGLYQARFGVRDVASGRAGSANEWIEIPKLTPGEVSLSSLHIGERSATPITAASINDSNQHEDVSLSVDHRFESSSHLRFVVFVYNAAQAADSKPDVALQILITRDNQPVITTPLKKVTSEGFPDLSRIPYAAEISLAGLTSGRYVLKVNVVDRVSKRSASQETKIEID